MPYEREGHRVLPVRGGAGEVAPMADAAACLGPPTTVQTGLSGLTQAAPFVTAVSINVTVEVKYS